MRGQQDGPQEPLDLAKSPPRQGHSLCVVVGTELIGYRRDTGDRKCRQLFWGAISAQGKKQLEAQARRGGRSPF